MDLLDEDAVASRWLSWCQKQKLVKCIEYDVPVGILPPGVKGTLYDVKVYGKHRCPDDEIYAHHEELRKKVARGNCVLHLQPSGLVKGDGDAMLNGFKRGLHLFVTFALRKFSGGLGDEDEDYVALQDMWNLYFLKPVELADRIVATVKANGEAAHLSCRVLGGQVYYVLGSKNVHLLARNLDDVVKYSESRFAFARIIARTFFEHSLEHMGPEKLNRLTEYLNVTRSTAVFEILQPDNEHIVNLSYLKKPELQFICWAQPYVEDESVSLCGMPPNEAIDMARSFGLDTVDYTVILPSGLEKEMSKIRADVGYEGKVLYFLDGSGNVFGILKKKTCWYIMLRAIREKTANFTTQKSPKSLSQIRERVAKRLMDIQVWLGLSDQYRKAWMDLAMGFIQWVMSKPEPEFPVRSHFPRLWEKFISSSEKFVNIYNNLEYA